ncbi:TagK domain-containing protein [Paraburkholderia sp. J7]|uniref:TagK domain-containing protein n=1 Tax=Paraburkholderia sp. J7 TaxID=2805438 RepID=UPI002AB68FCA|nr:TagK domain-containing protein [Paraburkholderia sp. J7]
MPVDSDVGGLPGYGTYVTGESAMWITRFFRSRVSTIERNDEPTGLSQLARGVSVVSEPASRRFDAGSDDPANVRVDVASRGTEEDPILDLLGSHLDDRGRQFDPAFGQSASPAAASIDGNGLLGTLYASYCKALDTPQSLMSGTWVPSSLGTPVSEPIHDHPETWDTGAGGAISGLFSDIERMEQAFGGLGSDRAPDPGESVPEILRLFAPPEYRAKPAGEPTRPPALTQREHHTLAIDSPLNEPGGALKKTDNHS